MEEAFGYLVLPSLQGYKVMYPKTQKGLYGFLTFSLGNRLSRWQEALLCDAGKQNL